MLVSRGPFWLWVPATIKHQVSVLRRLPVHHGVLAVVANLDCGPQIGPQLILSSLNSLPVVLVEGFSPHQKILRRRSCHSSEAPLQGRSMCTKEIVAQAGVREKCFQARKFHSEPDLIAVSTCGIGTSPEPAKPPPGLRGNTSDSTPVYWLS